MSDDAVEEVGEFHLLDILRTMGLEMLDVRPLVMMPVALLARGPVLDEDEAAGLVLIDEEVVA